MDNNIFDWDKANISHIAEHAITPEEAEQVILSDPLDFGFDDQDIHGEERWTYLGETDQGRILMVVMTLRVRKIRILTAFDAERQDKRTYLKWKAGMNDRANRVESS